MIIEIKIANYRSINAEQTFSFVAENAARHKDNLIPRKGYKLLKAAALFGANASGKSNLVKAIKVMCDFVRDSATRMNDGDPIPAAEPFRLDPNTRNAPSRFEMTFLTNDLLYNYGFAADRKRVYEEWLKAEPEGTDVETFGFHRAYDAKTDTYVYDCRGTLQPVADLLHARTRSNALTLSTGARENVQELLIPYRFFRDHIQVYDMSFLVDRLVFKTADLCERNVALRTQVSVLLRDADTDIGEIRVEYERPEAIPADLTEIRDGSLSHPYVQVGRTKYPLSQVITSIHRDSEGNPVEFDFENEESNGTQHLFALASIFINALESGALIVVDELDASMHPLLSRKLLELFQSTHANPNGAQLLFTTHDPSLLDQELFRRDQLWITEKRDGASTFFSLMDIEPPLDNREALLRNYLSGRYGGTPHLGRTFDTLKIGAAK